MADFVADMQRRGVIGGEFAGITWGDFQRAMQRLGVQDDDRIASIEYGVALGSSGRICRDDDVDGVEIREVR